MPIILEKRKLPSGILYFLLAIIVAVIVTVISYQLWTTSATTPSLEGFAGPSKGVSQLHCGQSSSDATSLYTLLSNKTLTTEDGADDLRELNLLLGKLCCLKRDLLAPGSLVSATRGEPFSTSHDMEPTSETVARCFAKTVPKRDLELIVEKWSKRSNMLVRRICTAYSLTDSEVKTAVQLLGKVLADISDILMTVCLKGSVTIAGEAGPRMVHGVEPTGNSALGDYKGYY
jgi:hypothetical protein